MTESELTAMEDKTRQSRVVFTLIQKIDRLLTSHESDPGLCELYRDIGESLDELLTPEEVQEALSEALRRKKARLEEDFKKL